MDEEPIQIFYLKKRCTNKQKTYGKVFNITNLQGTAKQNHNEITPHICQKGYYQKEDKM